MRLESFHPEKESPKSDSFDFSGIEGINSKIICRLHSMDSILFYDANLKAVEQLIGVTQAQVRDSSINKPNMALMTPQEKLNHVRFKVEMRYRISLKYREDFEKLIDAENTDDAFKNIQELTKALAMDLGVRTAFSLLWESLYGSLDYGKNPWCLLVF